MTCPSDETQLAALLGELSVNESRALEQHRESCAVCRLALADERQLLADLAARPVLADSEDVFTAKVMAACAASPRPQHAPSASRSKVVWSSSLALAACAAAWLVIAPMHDVMPEYQARGVATGRTPVVSTDLLFVRNAVLEPLRGAQLRDGDALAVRYTNAGDVPKYLAVFALDTQHELHWIYPAYIDAAEDPGSVALPPGTRDKLLDEVVEPESPAPGALQVFAVVTTAPIHVREVEAVRAQLSSERLRTMFTGADVQTWRATWIRD